jgi:DNA-binding PucR family transcriptional regulator
MAGSGAGPRRRTDQTRVSAHATAGELALVLGAQATLDDLVQTLADAVGNPVTIEDHAFRLLSYSRQPGRVDRARRETILSKAVPPRIVRWLHETGAVQRIHLSPGAVHIDANTELGLERRTAIAVRAGDRVLGHIWILETRRRLTPEELRALPQAAITAAVLLLRREVDEEAHARLVRDFLVDLIDGQVGSEAAARRRAEDLGIERPEWVAVVVADVDAFEEHVGAHDEAWVQAFKARLLAAIRGRAVGLAERPLLLIRSDSVVTIIGDSPGGAGAPALHDRVRRLASALDAHLHERFPDLSFSIGASQALRGLVRLPEAYRQAAQAAEICRTLFGGRRAVHFTDLGVYRLLHVIKSRNEVEGYRNPHLEALEAYDRRHRTDLVRTLSVYLDAFGRLGPAAAALRIHANTLAYRIGRIREIAGLDLDDPGQRLTIHLELKVRELRAP